MEECCDWERVMAARSFSVKTGRKLSLKPQCGRRGGELAVGLLGAGGPKRLIRCVGTPRLKLPPTGLLDRPSQSSVWALHGREGRGENRSKERDLAR